MNPGLKTVNIVLSSPQRAPFAFLLLLLFSDVSFLHMTPIFACCAPQHYIVNAWLIYCPLSASLFQHFHFLDFFGIFESQQTERSILEAILCKLLPHYTFHLMQPLLIFL